MSIINTFTLTMKVETCQSGGALTLTAPTAPTPMSVHKRPTPVRVHAVQVF